MTLEKLLRIEIPSQWGGKSHYPSFHITVLGKGPNGIRIKLTSPEVEDVEFFVQGNKLSVE